MLVQEQNVTPMKPRPENVKTWSRYKSTMGVGEIAFKPSEGSEQAFFVEENSKKKGQG